MGASLQHSLLLLLTFMIPTAVWISAMEERRSYIIHMDQSAMPAPFVTHDHWYRSLLSSLSVPDSGLPPTHLYTYNHVLRGFSAMLSDSQLRQLESLPGHVATIPESFAKLHTTHTPRFLGLNRHGGLWPAAKFGDDVIIGIIDTGIWPESESFDDRHMPPVPARWKGQCETGTAFNSSDCNKKLIGARSFSKGFKQYGFNISTEYDYDSPRDFFGHGTHTTSTAAGSPARCANYFGYAKGTAVGMAPMARVAMYKTVFYGDTFESAASDVLAGMDQAIADGVDVMSLSLGFPDSPYYMDVMAMGAFAALEKGIFVACSAGNDGPDGYSIINGAPWITTVGASTIDRDYQAVMTFGNDSWTIQGKSVYPESLFIRRAPLYFVQGNTTTEKCVYGSLDPEAVAGKVVFCTSGDLREQFMELNRTAARAGIFTTDSADFLSPFDFSLPFVAISLVDGRGVYDYLGVYPTTGTVDIQFKKTVLGKKPAPQVAYFSSRGPNRASPSILKPDIVGPGVDILAAWASQKRAAVLGDSFLVSDYNIISGTSMSCPHIAGIAALLKAVHPDWTPAAIRSAMMTTALVTDNTNGPILDMVNKTANPLDFGGGHVNPNKAMDPGLVYDIELQDYVDFLCGLNYTATQIRMVTRSSNNSCRSPNLDLNYPSFVVLLNLTSSSTSTFSRTLTNVADNSTVYRAVVKAPAGMTVVVSPPTLAFGSRYSKMKFTVTVNVNLTSAGARVDGDYIGNYGYLSWYEDGGKHVVTSPIVSAYAPN